MMEGLCGGAFINALCGGYFVQSSYNSRKQLFDVSRNLAFD